MPKRVTLLIDSMAAGGAQTQIALLAATLDRSRYVPRLVWYNTAPRSAELAPDIEVLQIPRAGRFDPKFFAALATLGSRQHTDIVHAWLSIPATYAAAASALPFHAPVITAIRCSVGVLQAEPNSARLYRASALLGDHVTINAHDVAGWLSEKGIPQERIEFIPNMLPPSIVDRQPSTAQQRADLLRSLGLDPAHPPIGHLARFDRYKNQDGLVQALADVRDKLGEVPPLLLAGRQQDSDRVAQVRALAQQHALDVRIIPPVLDAASLMEACRFTVLPSHSEGTPNAVLEAMGLGTVVVATAVGEVPELIESNQNGFLCAAGDRGALAAVLEAALTQTPQAAAEMGQMARRKMVSRFAPAAIAAQYADLYDRVIAQDQPIWRGRLLDVARRVR